MIKKKRGKIQKIIDFITFPIRSFFAIEEDRLGLSSVRSERFYNAAKEVIGYCLDVGCGKHNLFIKEYLNKNGKGIDVFPYEGLTKENLISDMAHFPFKNNSFKSITFIANFNHIPKSMRDIELAEAYRCLRSGGNIIITMGHPIALIVVHKVVWLYDRLFGTNYDMDSIRGMHEEEAYYILDFEIIKRLTKAGYKNIKKKYFITQWGLNHLFIGWKK